MLPSGPLGTPLAPVPGWPWLPSRGAPPRRTRAQRSEFALLPINSCPIHAPTIAQFVMRIHGPESIHQPQRLQMRHSLLSFDYADLYCCKPILKAGDLREGRS